MENKKLAEALMYYSFIICGYRAFINVKVPEPSTADDFVENYLNEHGIDPVEAGFIKKRKE